MSTTGQLRLAFSSSNASSRTKRLSSVKCRSLRAGSSRSPLQQKIARLEREKPSAAALIEKLADDMLDDLPRYSAAMEWLQRGRTLPDERCHEALFDPAGMTASVFVRQSNRSHDRVNLRAHVHRLP